MEKALSLTIPMQNVLADVEKALRCSDCSYNEKGQLVYECGLCQAKAIEQRIKWWQEGKKQLNDRGEYYLVGDERRNKIQ